MTPKRAAQLLRLTSAGTVLFGLMLMLAPHSPLKPAGLVFVDLAFLPLDRTQDMDHEVAQLMMAISGGLLCGLGVLIWQITTRLFLQNPTLARRILIPALLAWYLPDSLGSMLSGAGFNVVMNTVFLAMFMVPLLRGAPASPSDAQFSRQS
ncbi:excinuclease ABC subunit A [Tritonibacter mobilis]|uniref:excinuclease ABC subunit A n=1 Tax=Tritonibacter mobilis TaxID=379347 RepID=UPI000806E0DB|nr:excinuclease ABC subunit A [Tritonibacter mobilis]